MKFGKYLAENSRPEWAEHYLDYNALKDLIKKAAQEIEESGVSNYSPRMTSLTVVRATARTDTSEELFFQRLEAEVDKVSTFTSIIVSQLRDRLHAVQDNVATATDPEQRAHLLQEAKDIGDEFLQLEKYVNLNYMGFHKALKKHDKMLPHSPCRQFYISHLHNQPWVQGNYSDLLVLLSSVYSQLREDVGASATSSKEMEDGVPTKPISATFWVRVGDVSSVKHLVVQNLPVFSYTSPRNDFITDSELVNSITLDNSSLELYHARLDKRPNAVTMRLRWHGTPDPKIVWLERKTYRESWKGAETVKEYCPLREDKVLDFLEGKYSPESYAVDFGNSDFWGEDVDASLLKQKPEEAVEAFQACQQMIDAKQLKPMIRTQFMRTTFAIPFDSTVTVHLDTNIMMFKENSDDDSSALTLSGRWYRDLARFPLERTEVTRFPHAIFEVKLQLHPVDGPPEWVQDLLDSGLLLEVHKFSKSIHGVATLFPVAVQAVPYWVDDPSVKASMLLSAPEAPTDIAPSARDKLRLEGQSQKPRKVLEGSGDVENTQARSLGDLDEESESLTRPLLSGFREREHHLMNAMRESTKRLKKRGKAALGPVAKGIEWWFSKPLPGTPGTSISAPYQPKTYLANERTFLAWLHMSVTMGSISAALLGYSANSKASPATSSQDLIGLIAVIMLPIAILMAGYSLLLFLWRSQELRTESHKFIDDRRGPLALAGIICAALTLIFFVGLGDLISLLVGHQLLFVSY